MTLLHLLDTGKLRMVAPRLSILQEIPFSAGVNLS